MGLVILGVPDESAWQFISQGGGVCVVWGLVISTGVRDRVCGEGEKGWGGLVDARLTCNLHTGIYLILHHPFADNDFILTCMDNQNFSMYSSTLIGTKF